jgi:hypothetical protein
LVDWLADWAEYSAHVLPRQHTVAPLYFAAHCAQPAGSSAWMFCQSEQVSPFRTVAEQRSEVK